MNRRRRNREPIAGAAVSAVAVTLALVMFLGSFL